MVGTFFKITQLRDTRQDCGPDNLCVTSELLAQFTQSYLLPSELELSLS